MLKITTLILIVSITGISAVTKVIPDQRYQYCTFSGSNSDRLRNGQPVIGKILDVDVDFDVDDDEKVTIVGNMTFKIDIKKPLFLRLTGEKYQQAGWHKMSVKTEENVCESFFKPTEMYYDVFKDAKRCPLSKGVSLLPK